MKFLFISPRYSGGIGGHASMLGYKLTELGHEVDYMKIPHIPIKNLKNPSFTLLSIFKGIFSENYDIVHAFNVPSVFAMKIAKGKKRVLSVHGVFSDQIKSLHSKNLGFFSEKIESSVLKWPDALTTDSQFTQKMYKQKLDLDLFYLPSPIDTSKLDAIENVKKIDGQISYIGRDSYEKGIDIIRNLEHKFNGKVVYSTNLPWKDAMKNLKASNVLILPSRIESSPTSIKEAFYLKIPVVATNVGGVSELVKNGITGILVPSDNFEKIVTSVNHLLENKEKSNQFINSAYNFIIKNFTWDVILPKYIKFYKELLN